MKTNKWRRAVLICGVAGVALTAAFLPAVQSPQDGAAAPMSADGAKATNGVAANTITHTLAAKDADAAWAELQAASTKPPIFPDEWQLKEPTPEEQTKFLLPYVLAIADKSKDFYSRFPTDTNALGAKQIEYGILTWALNKGATNQQARFDAAEKNLLSDTNLGEDDRFEMRNSTVERAVHAKESEGDEAMLAEFEKGTRALQKEFPKRPEITAMLLQIAENSDAEKARGVLKEIAASDAPAELKDAAADMQKHLDKVGTPVALKFTALDGREVDTAKMQGKVVLVDFWATDCEPCVGLIGDIKEAYDKLHAKGLEVVGINLDEDKDNLTHYIADQKLDWPEYFDGLAMQTKLAVQFDVKDRDMPVVWLVDKKGVLRYINAGFDLNKKIEALVAE